MQSTISLYETAPEDQQAGQETAEFPRDPDPHQERSAADLCICNIAAAMSLGDEMAGEAKFLIIYMLYRMLGSTL